MLDQAIHVLLVLSAVSFLMGGASRFLKFQILGQEPTVWWRGSMGLLGYSVALMIWRILQTISAR